jgi:outer membrane protein assembly factor BamD
MFENRPSLPILIVISAMLLGGCRGYEKLLKSRDFQKKYEVGLQYYEDGDYARSAALFDRVITDSGTT